MLRPYENEWICLHRKLGAVCTDNLATITTVVVTMLLMPPPSDPKLLEIILHLQNDEQLAEPPYHKFCVPGQSLAGPPSILALGMLMAFPPALTGYYRSVNDNEATEIHVRAHPGGCEIAMGGREELLNSSKITGFGDGFVPL
jgi:hypothetical protein